MNMLDLQINICGIAVGAGAAPLVEQVFPDFVAEESALLILYPGDLRILHLLRVKANMLDTQRRNRGPPRHFFHRMKGLVYAGG